jgi:fluoride ion exporter CrcB/FEX
MERKKKKKNEERKSQIGEWHLQLAIRFFTGVLIVTIIGSFLFLMSVHYINPSPELNLTRTAIYYGCCGSTTLKHLATIDAQQTLSWQETQTALPTP